MVMADNSDVDFYENLLTSEVIPDTYTSLPRGRGRRRNHDFSRPHNNQTNQTEYLYGTYRRSKPYTNFATAFEDEFRSSQNSKHNSYLNDSSNNVIARDQPNTYHHSEYNSREFEDYRPGPEAANQHDFHNGYGNGHVTMSEHNQGINGLPSGQNGLSGISPGREYQENHQGEFPFDKEEIYRILEPLKPLEPKFT